MNKLRDKMPYAPRQDEKELVEKCMQGDQRAQQKLFEKYYGKMLGVCQRYTRDREEAKDVLQEAFVKIFQKIDQFNFNSPLEGWIRRIMVNTSIDYYRKSNATPVTYDLNIADEVAEENNVISEMSHTELLACLQDLPAGYKLVFNMYVIEGFSHKEIADTLGITEGTSKSQLSKARTFLQKLIAHKFTRQDG